MVGHVIVTAHRSASGSSTPRGRKMVSGLAKYLFPSTVLRSSDLLRVVCVTAISPLFAGS